MKKLVFLLSVFTLTLTSCSSSDDAASTATTDPNEVLPLKIVTESPDGDYTDNFFYNGKKITKIESTDGQKTVFTYTGNLITKVETFFDGDLDETETFTYNSDNKLIGYTTVFAGSPSFSTTETYIHNANGTMSFSNYDDGVLYSTGTYTFVGNDILNVVSSYVGFPITSTNSYTYDTKYSPFKNIVGYNWYAISGSENQSSPGFDHNSLTFTDSETPSNNTSSTYIYNSLNFPTSVNFTDNNSVETSTITYN